MKRVWIALCAAAIVSAQAHAQAQRPRQQAGSTVEGDVYLLMKSGDTKKGAGLTIYLRALTDALTLELRDICTAYRELNDETENVDVQNAVTLANAMLEANTDEVRRLKKKGDSLQAALTAQKAAAARKIRATITATPGVEAGTGMNAHYRLERVPPGKYFLFGEWKIGDNNYQWWAPIEVPPATTLKKDLDNSVVADGLASCDEAS